MPKFIDYHATMPQLPPEAMEGIQKSLKAGQPDQFGVTGVNIYLGSNGTAFCLSEGPNVDAVVKSHEALGFSLKDHDVTQVQSVV